MATRVTIAMDAVSIPVEPGQDVDLRIRLRWKREGQIYRLESSMTATAVEPKKGPVLKHRRMVNKEVGDG